MKQKDIFYVVGIALFAAIFSFVIAGLVFKSPAKHSTDVPIVQPIESSFPDIKNDPSYKVFFNPQALNPTQPIQIGNGQNPQPFNSSR